MTQILILAGAVIAAVPLAFVLGLLVERLRH